MSVAAVLFPPGYVFTNASFVPLAGGKLYFYLASSTTPQNTWTLSDRTTANSNPVILNASGFSDTMLFANDAAYEVNLKTSADVQVPGWPVLIYAVANAIP